DVERVPVDLRRVADDLLAHGRAKHAVAVVEELRRDRVPRLEHVTRLHDGDSVAFSHDGAELVIVVRDDVLAFHGTSRFAGLSQYNAEGAGIRYAGWSFWPLLG